MGSKHSLLVILFFPDKAQRHFRREKPLVEAEQAYIKQQKKPCYLLETVHAQACCSCQNNPNSQRFRCTGSGKIPTLGSEVQLKLNYEIPITMRVLTETMAPLRTLDRSKFNDKKGLFANSLKGKHFYGTMTSHICPSVSIKGGKLTCVAGNARQAGQIGRLARKNMLEYMCNEYPWWTKKSWVQGIEIPRRVFLTCLIVTTDCKLVAKASLSEVHPKGTSIPGLVRAAVASYNLAQTGGDLRL